MAEVMSCENTLQLKGKLSVTKETILVSPLPVSGLFYLYFIIHMADISLSWDTNVGDLMLRENAAKLSKVMQY